MTTAAVIWLPAGDPNREKISRDIATYDGVLKAARDKWDDWAVTWGSWLGGVDPKQVQGAIEANAKRGEWWKARGAALAAGHPLDLDDDPARVKLDTLELWIAFGNTLIRELESAAQLRASAGLDNAIIHTTKETVTTVGEGVGELAVTVNEVGTSLWSWRKPFVWVGLAVGAVILLVNVGAITALTKAKKQIKALVK